MAKRRQKRKKEKTQLTKEIPPRQKSVTPSPNHILQMTAPSRKINQAQTCSVVVVAGGGGVKEGVVTVHLAQVVTVAVVKKVDVVVMTSMDVLPPLW